VTLGRGTEEPENSKTDEPQNRGTEEPEKWGSRRREKDEILGGGSVQ